MDDPINRREFEGYIRRHEADLDAHAPAQRRNRADRDELLMELGTRVTGLERFQERIMGALILLGVVMGSGLVAAAFEVSRR